MGGRFVETTNSYDPVEQSVAQRTQSEPGVYIDDVDQAVERAIAGGAQLLVPLQNQFYGDRTAWIMDPSGHVWTIATRVEATSEQQRKDRWSSIQADGDRA